MMEIQLKSGAGMFVPVPLDYTTEEVGEWAVYWIGEVGPAEKLCSCPTEYSATIIAKSLNGERIGQGLPLICSGTSEMQKINAGRKQ